MASLERVLAEHGYVETQDPHCVPGVCFSAGYTADDPCPSGRTTIHVEQVDERWYVTSMLLEDLLPLIPADYGTEPCE